MPKKKENKKKGVSMGTFAALFFAGRQTRHTARTGELFNIRRVKQNLAILIAINILVGIAMIVIGVTNLTHHRLSYDMTPTGMWYVQDYFLLTTIGSIYFLISCSGYAGICESRNTFAKSYMLGSVSFGFGLLQIFIIWISTIDFLIPQEMQKPEFTHEYYFIVILIASISQLVSGGFAFVISANYANSRGYYTLNAEEANLADFFAEIEKGLEEEKNAPGRRWTT